MLPVVENSGYRVRAKHAVTHRLTETPLPGSLEPTDSPQLILFRGLQSAESAFEWFADAARIALNTDLLLLGHTIMREAGSIVSDDTTGDMVVYHHNRGFLEPDEFIRKRGDVPQIVLPPFLFADVLLTQDGRVFTVNSTVEEGVDIISSLGITVSE